MDVIRWIIPIVLLTFVRASSDELNTDPLSNAIISIVSRLHDQHINIGKFDLWILDISVTPFFQEVAEKVCRSGELVYVTKQTVTLQGLQQIGTNIPAGVLIVLLDPVYKSAESTLIYNTLMKFTHNVHVLAVFNHAKGVLFQRIKKWFYPLQMTKILYIDVKQDTGDYIIGQYNLFLERMLPCNESDSVNVLFPDQVSNLYKRDCHVCALQRAPFVDNASPTKGIDVRLAKTILKNINATITLRMLPSRESMSESEYNRRVLHCNFELNRYLVKANLSSFVWNLIPHPFVVVVHRGRLLTTLELFLMPFNFYVWMVILVIIFIGYALMLAFPNTFLNDLIMLAMFGIENYDLNRTSKLEKTLVMSLMVFSFLMACGYEALIISSLTEWPRLPNYKSVDDLARAGGKILIDDSVTMKSIRENFKLKPLLANRSEFTAFVLRTRTPPAAIDGYYNARIWINQLRDPTSGEKTFLILEDRFSVNYLAYYFGGRNVLTRKFELLQRRIFESGLYLYWLEQHEVEKIGGRLKFLKRNDGTGNNSQVVNVENLIPVWTLFGLCWGICIAALMIEIAVSKWKIFIERKKIKPLQDQRNQIRMFGKYP